MIDLIVLISLLVLGYVFGQMAEKRHFSSIQKREKTLKNILVFNERFPPPQQAQTDIAMVSGNVVISVDYFKTFVAGLRQLIGGRLTSYESLLERGRREALLRMKEQASEKGANSIFNVKVETATISGNANRGIGSIEVYAYGTAIIS